MMRTTYYTMLAQSRCDRYTKFEANFAHWPTIEQILQVAEAEIQRLTPDGEGDYGGDACTTEDDIGYIRRCLEFLRLVTPEQLQDPMPDNAARRVIAVRVAGVEIGSITFTPYHVYRNT